MRDLLIIGGISVTAIVVGSLLFFFGPVSFQTETRSAFGSGAIGDNPAVQFTVLAQGPVARSVTQQTNYRITSDSDLTTLWPMVYGSVDTPAAPSVDFSKYELLAVFDGSHSTGDYGISVAKVADKGGTRTVMITHTVPGSACSVTSTVTSPFVILEVPKTQFPLAHQDMTNTTSCP